MINLKIIENNLRPGKHSETLLINQLSQLRSDNNQSVYKFGFGQSPFPVPSKITKALSDASHRKEYMSVQGHKPLRDAIVSFHNNLENKSWSSEQVIVGAGSKILLFCIMAAFQKAEVLLPAPSWVSYEPQGKLAGHKVTWLTTMFENKWHLTPQQLSTFCEAREDKKTPLILVFNYPSNPTGQTYSKGELEDLANVMRKHHVIVIADEIYSLLNYDSNYSTLDDYYPEGCIVSSGLSKWCGAGGWRLGFNHIPKQLGDKFFQAVIGVASETYSCAPSPIQVAATEAYNDQELAISFLQKQTVLLKEISHYCCDLLKISNVKVHHAQGGFYLFPQFDFYTKKLIAKTINTSEQLTAAIMDETGVALLPGTAFGMKPTSLTVRLAFVDFDGSQILDEQIQPAQFDKVKEGIKKLCTWLENL
jgi:aspartate aminotransferase